MPTSTSTFGFYAASRRRLGTLPFEDRHDIGVRYTVSERAGSSDFPIILHYPLINYFIISGAEKSDSVFAHRTIRKENVPYIIRGNFSYELLLMLGIHYSR